MIRGCNLSLPTKILVSLIGISLLIGSLTGCDAVNPESQLKPHQDPKLASVEYDLSGLISAYTGVLSLITSGDYQNVDTMLKELKSANADSELLNLFERFNTLSQELSNSLSQVESLLEKASQLIAQNDLVTAENQLGTAAFQLAQISLLPPEIHAINESIGDLLNIAALSSSNRLYQSYQELMNSTDRLQEAVDRLDSLRQQLAEMNSEAQAVLMQTELTLNLTATNPVFVGENITVNGRLSAGNENLEERAVTILFDGKSYDTITSTDGSYQITLPVPYRYTNELNIQSRFSPKGDDTDRFQMAYSSTKKLAVTYHQTQLDIKLPDVLRPGLAFMLEGSLSSDGPTIFRSIQVFINGQLAKETSAVDTFNLNITPPKTINSETTRITVTVLPDKRYAPASTSRSVPLTPMLLNASIDIPDFIMLPNQINVTGTVRGENEYLSEATVDLFYVNQTISIITDASGRFGAELEFPLDLTLFGSRTFDVTITPAEPWYAPLTIQREISFINPVSSGGVLLLILGLAVIGRLRSGTPVPRQKRQKTVDTNLLPTKTAPAIQFEDAHNNGIIRAYLSARMMMESWTNNQILPHYTIREYLQLIINRIPLFKSAFAELSILAEIVLYSHLKTTDSNLLRASQLLRSMKEDQKRGTP